MNITNSLIIGTDLANKINDYVINNHHKTINNPKIKIINYSNKDFIGKTGELIYKGKKYSMIKFDTIDIPNYLNPIYKISNDCFEIIKD